jgi:S1-C subfamily serine protease
MLLHAMILAALTTAGDGSSVVTIRREGTPGITELSTGVAISEHHVITLSAFATPDSPPVVEVDGEIFEPDTIYYSEGLGLAILSFSERPFEVYTSPAPGLPEIGTPVTLVGQGISGPVSVSARIVQIYEDGAMLLSAPRMVGLMGAGAFEEDGAFVGLVRGIIATSLDNAPSGSTEFLAMLPSQTWSVWADLAMGGHWTDGQQFGVTATAYSSLNSDERPSGVLIVAVDDGSTACDCGLRPGDLVVAMDSIRIYHPETMRGLLMSSEDSLDTRVWSRGTTRMIRLPPLR